MQGLEVTGDKAGRIPFVFFFNINCQFRACYWNSINTSFQNYGDITFVFCLC